MYVSNMTSVVDNGRGSYQRSKPQIQSHARPHRLSQVHRTGNLNGSKLEKINTMHSPRGVRRRPSQISPASVAGLTDGFDAITTEAPTDWNTTGIEGVEGRDYSVSVSGYRNYVNEMERMLGGEVDVQLNSVSGARDGGRGSVRRERVRDVKSPSESVRGTDAGASGRRPGLGSYASIDNARHVTGRKGRMELVEHKIMEDGPERTISLWRERVAQSGDGGSRFEGESNRAEASHSRAHRRAASEIHGSRVPEEYRSGNRGPGQSSSSFGPGRNKETSRDSNGGYERTEYMVSYHKPSRSTGMIPERTYTASESARATIGHGQSMTSSRPKTQSVSVNTATPMSPSIRRTSGRSSYGRTEYMVTYLHTPPLSQDSGDSRKHHGSQATHHPTMSPIQNRTYMPIEPLDTSSVAKATCTSPVELVLATCEPSLLHIAPVLSDLGILKLEHLRAMARMSDETRDRELKNIALMRGVTVMEWAILLDKLQTL